MLAFAVLLGRVIAGLLALLVAAVGVSALISAAQAAEPRGRLVDIGDGRRMRLVCEGPRTSAGPTVWTESGAFATAADWAEVQAQLARQGVRSCAYDRAGMG